MSRAADRAAPRAIARAALVGLVGVLALSSTGCDNRNPGASRVNRALPAGSAAAPAPTPPPAPAPTVGSATLRWVAPTQTSDGQPLTDLAGYRVYFGQSTVVLDRTVTVGPNETMAVITGLGPGTWFFGVAAFTGQGIESSMSNVVSKHF